MKEFETFLNVENAAKELNIPSNTFTRHYLDFEEQGYKFKRSLEGKLMFSEDDMELFKEFLELKTQPKMTKRKAIKQLISTPTSVTTIKTHDLITLISAIEDKFEELKEKSKQELQELKEQLQEFEQNKIGERDQILLESIRETQESKKMLLELKAQNDLIMKELASAKESKSKKWYEFWK